MTATPTLVCHHRIASSWAAPLVVQPPSRPPLLCSPHAATPAAQPLGFACPWLPLLHRNHHCIGVPPLAATPALGCPHCSTALSASMPLPSSYPALLVSSPRRLPPSSSPLLLVSSPPCLLPSSSPPLVVSSSHRLLLASWPHSCSPVVGCPTCIAALWLPPRRLAFRLPPWQRSPFACPIRTAAPWLAHLFSLRVAHSPLSAMTAAPRCTTHIVAPLAALCSPA